MTYFVAVALMCIGPMASDCRYAVRPVITASESDCNIELGKQLKAVRERNIFAVGSCIPVQMDGENT